MHVCSVAFHNTHLAWSDYFLKFLHIDSYTAPSNNTYILTPACARSQVAHIRHTHVRVVGRVGEWKMSHARTRTHARTSRQLKHVRTHTHRRARAGVRRRRRRNSCARVFARMCVCVVYIIIAYTAGVRAAAAAHEIYVHSLCFVCTCVSCVSRVSRVFVCVCVFMCEYAFYLRTLVGGERSFRDNRRQITTTTTTTAAAAVAPHRTI